MFLVFEVHGDPGSSPVSLKERLNACEDLQIVSDLSYPYNLISIVPHIVIIFIYFCFQPHWIFGLMFFFGGLNHQPVYFVWWPPTVQAVRRDFQADADAVAVVVQLEKELRLPKTNWQPATHEYMLL